MSRKDVLQKSDAIALCVSVPIGVSCTYIVGESKEKGVSPGALQVSGIDSLQCDKSSD